MPAQTGRLALYLPGGGSLGIGGADEPADIDKINQNFQKLDTSIGAPDSLSSGRPATPYVGQLIRETDTGDFRRFDGTQWRLLTPHVGTAAPAAPILGDLWVDTN